VIVSGVQLPCLAVLWGIGTCDRSGDYTPCRGKNRNRSWRCCDTGTVKITTHVTPDERAGEYCHGEPEEQERVDGQFCQRPLAPKGRSSAPDSPEVLGRVTAARIIVMANARMYGIYTPSTLARFPHCISLRSPRDSPSA
jgi:hypothetical protein